MKEKETFIADNLSFFFNSFVIKFWFKININIIFDWEAFVEWR